MDNARYWSHCQSGKRWFWCVKEITYDTDSGEAVLLGSGYCDTKEDCQLAVQQYEPFGFGMLTAATARQELRKRRAERNRQRTTANTTTDKIEYVYSDSGNRRIVKKTKTRVYAASWEMENHPYDWEHYAPTTFVLDRKKLEQGEGVWSRSQGSHYYISEEARRADQYHYCHPALQALGLPHDATADAIKKAYKRLAKNAHPDRGGSDDQFRELHRQYEMALAVV